VREAEEGCSSIPLSLTTSSHHCPLPPHLWAGWVSAILAFPPPLPTFPPPSPPPTLPAREAGPRAPPLHTCPHYRTDSGRSHRKIPPPPPPLGRQATMPWSTCRLPGGRAWRSRRHPPPPLAGVFAPANFSAIILPPDPFPGFQPAAHTLHTVPRHARRTPRTCLPFSPCCLIYTADIACAQPACFTLLQSALPRRPVTASPHLPGSQALPHGASLPAHMSRRMPALYAWRDAALPPASTPHCRHHADTSTRVPAFTHPAYRSTWRTLPLALAHAPHAYRRFYTWVPAVTWDQQLQHATTLPYSFTAPHLLPRLARRLIPDGFGVLPFSPPTLFHTVHTVLFFAPFTTVTRYLPITYHNARVPALLCRAYRAPCTVNDSCGSARGRTRSLQHTFH